MSAAVRVVVNGAERTLAPGTSLADLVATLSSQQGCAVAVDGVVVPRSAWSAHVLSGGEHVDIVTAVQGG